MPDSLSSIVLFRSPPTPLQPPLVAISACLNGEAVRYDGTDKSLQNTLAMLNNHLQLKPICPEVGAGMSIPRAPVQLVQQQDRSISVLGRDDPHLDVTDALLHFSHSTLASLDETLTGYIVKSRSPSCGFESTPLFNSDGKTIGLSSGVQIDYFHRQLPWLQIVDEYDLASAADCEFFISRCLLLNDIRTHSQPGNLAGLSRHYGHWIAAMPKEHQQQIESCEREGDGHAYWQAFGGGLQALRQQRRP